METRQKVKDPVFGYPKWIRGDQLPTQLDVGQHFLFRKGNQRNAPNKEALHRTAEDLQQIWIMACVPTIEQDSIKRKVERLVQKVGKSKAKKGPKVSSDELLGLFDMCSCKCEEGCCSCPSDKKTPEKEREFVKDQRSVRKMFIGQEDKEETTRIQQKL